VNRLFVFIIFLSLFWAGCSDESPDCPIQENPPEVDSVRPSRVSDLRASSLSDSSVTLTWTAPGDDGTEGRASLYDIRYSVSLAAVQEWSNLCLTGPELTPSVSGGIETATISSLDQDTEYYFALRSADEYANWSATSNILAAQSTCAVLFHSPLPADVFCQGDTMDIVWSISECQEDVLDLVLLADGNIRYYLVRNLQNTGMFRWPVDAHGSLDGEFSIGAIQADESIIHSSEGSFAISERCAVETISPNGGEVFCRGESVRIVWNQSSCCPAPVLVELMQNYSVIDTLDGVLASGDFWQVETPLPAEDGYRLKVTNLATGISDVSDYSFQITGPYPPVVLFPSGGNPINEGEDIEISWTPGSCLSGFVKIDLQHNEEPILTISSMTEDDGQFLWSALSEGDTENGYRITVTNLDSGFSGISPMPFSIQKSCHLTYRTPHEGTYFCMHDPMEITWDSGRWCVETVSIDILQGSHQISLSGEIPNTGIWQGTAPSQNFPGGSRIRIMETGTGDAVIGPEINLQPACSMSIFSYGNVFEGQPVVIAWEAEECCGPALRIELLHDGTVCRVISDDADKSNFYYNWIAEGCEGARDNYRFRITEPENGYSATTAYSFNISQGCGFSITDPCDGTVYNDGDTITVSWVSGTFCSDEVIVRMSKFPGDELVYGPITVPDDGGWEFIPENMPVGIYYCFIRLTDPVSGNSQGSWGLEYRNPATELKPE